MKRTHFTHRYGDRCYSNRKEAIERSEAYYTSRAKERQLNAVLQRDIDGGAASLTSETVDRRHNPAVADEDWTLSHQLEHGARLTPHRS